MHGPVALRGQSPSSFTKRTAPSVKAAGAVEGVGVGTVPGAGDFQAGGAAEAGAALGVAQQQAADTSALGILGDHKGGDPAGGGAQRQVVHEVEGEQAQATPRLRARIRAWRSLCRTVLIRSAASAGSQG